MKQQILLWKMACRRAKQTIVLLAFIIMVTVFLLMYPQMIRSVEDKLQFAYDTIDVQGWLINAEGFDDPRIPMELYEKFANTAYVDTCNAYSYAYFSMPDREDLSALWESMETPSWTGLVELYNRRLKNIRCDPPKLMYGMNSEDAEQGFWRIRENVTWLEGFSEDVFSTNAAVCIMPSFCGYELGESVPLVFRKFSSDSIYRQDDQRIAVLFQVVGIYQNDNSDSVTGGYCPMLAMQESLQDTWGFEVRSVQFDAKDNRELQDFKRYIVSLGMGEESAIRAVIDDRLLQGTITPIKKNLALLESLHGVFYALVAAIGFFLCFLLARGRKAEYAVMRMLGESTARVTCTALVEQLVLCAAGVLLGALAAGRGGGSLPTCAVILACYTLGAAVAVLLTVRVNVMEILRDKE